MLFSDQEVSLVHSAANVFGSSGHRVQAAGAWSVLIDHAAFGSEEGAGPFGVILHSEHQNRKAAVVPDLVGGVAIQEFPGGNPQPLSQTQNVVWREGEIEIRTALSEAGNTGVTSEGEFAIQNGFHRVPVQVVSVQDVVIHGSSQVDLAVFAGAQKKCLQRMGFAARRAEKREAGVFWPIYPFSRLGHFSSVSYPVLPQTSAR